MTNQPSDSNILMHQGRAYIEIPTNIKLGDAVVIRKQRLPHLRGVGDSALIASQRAEAEWCAHLVRMTSEARGGWHFPIQVPTEKACERLVELGLWEEYPEDFNLYRQIPATTMENGDE